MTDAFHDDFGPAPDEFLDIRPDDTSADELRRSLLLAGYEPGLPGHVGLTAAAIDRQCVRALLCPACGSKGLHYEPYGRRDAYRVVAACPCGFGEEL